MPNVAPAASPRLQELILYIAARMEDDRHAGRGRIKLAKLLWRSDFAAFWRLGSPITETAYHADRLGPVPTDELLAVRDLESEGRFELRNEWDRQQTPIAKESPRLHMFTREQMAIVDAQLNEYRLVSGTTMVVEAHEFPGWLHAWQDGAGKGAAIPYESVFWDDRTTLDDWEEHYALSLSTWLESDPSSS